MSEHLIKALEAQRNAALNEAAIAAARCADVQQIAGQQQQQIDALNGQINDLRAQVQKLTPALGADTVIEGEPSAEVVEAVKSEHGHRGGEAEEAARN